MSIREIPLMLALLVITTGTARLAVRQEGRNLEGVWRITEIKFIRADGDALVADPQPGLFIFAKSHYSTTWVSQSGPRKAYASRFQPTREELAAACDALVMNSGTYEVAGDRLTVRPLVTRVPEFPGGD